MADIQCATAETRRGKKEEEEERKKEETTGQNIMSASATQGGHNKCTAQTRMTLRSELFDIYFYFFKHT